MLAEDSTGSLDRLPLNTLKEHLLEAWTGRHQKIEQTSTEYSQRHVLYVCKQSSAGQMDRFSLDTLNRFPLDARRVSLRAYFIGMET